jgi:hypothetical protein
MTFKKPPSNSPPGDESPNHDDQSDGAPPDKTLDDPSVSKNKDLARLEAIIVTERKKRDAAERKLLTEVIFNRELKSDLKKANKSEHSVALKLAKTELAEHKARDAADVATKQEKLKASVATSKDLLASKDVALKASEKTRTQLTEDLEEEGKRLKKALDNIKELQAKIDECEDQSRQVKTLQTALEKANDVDTLRADAKMAHAMAMAELKLQRELN